MFVAARRDQRNGALMIGRIGVGVEARVQLRRNRETDGEQQRREQTTRNDSTELFAPAHVDRHCAVPSISAQGYFGGSGDGSARSLPITRQTLNFRRRR